LISELQCHLAARPPKSFLSGAAEKTKHGLSAEEGAEKKDL
jgi:hypothetical protein